MEKKSNINNVFLAAVVFLILIGQTNLFAMVNVCKSHIAATNRAQVKIVSGAYYYSHYKAERAKQSGIVEPG